MYVIKQQHVMYALSRIKSLLFDKITAWVAENSDTITMVGLFDKTKHWMRVHLQAIEAKQELIIIAIKNIKSVNKYYHCIFKLWTRANTFIDERIIKFTRLLKPGIFTPLLGRKFTSIRAVLDKAQDIKNAWKEITYTFPRQDNRQQQQSSSKFSHGSNSCGSVTSEDSAAGGGSAAGGSSGKNRKPTAIKPAGWSGTWYNLDLKPKKLKNNNKTTLSHQRCYWACRDSGHRGSDNYCPEFKKRLNLAVVMEVDSESEKK